MMVQSSRSELLNPAAKTRVSNKLESTNDCTKMIFKTAIKKTLENQNAANSYSSDVE